MDVRDRAVAFKEFADGFVIRYRRKIARLVHNYGGYRIEDGGRSFNTVRIVRWITRALEFPGTAAEKPDCVFRKMRRKITPRKACSQAEDFHTDSMRFVLLSGLPVLIVTALSLWQSTAFRNDLAGHILRSGRLVLSSGDFIHHKSDPQRNGNDDHVIDGDLESAAVLLYPSPHPQGTWLLIDLGLSHWPAPESDAAPRPRKPAYVEIFNGPCTRCDGTRFRSHGRWKSVRVELLARRANVMDEEYVIPPEEVLWSRLIRLPDAPGPERLDLSDVPQAPPSSGWPENMSYIRIKFTALDVYPGERFDDRIALSEIVYADVDPESGAIFRWE